MTGGENSLAAAPNHVCGPRKRGLQSIGSRLKPGRPVPELPQKRRRAALSRTGLTTVDGCRYAEHRENF